MNTLGPSGVPFIEMLEYKRRKNADGKCPSGVPFIEMLEWVWYMYSNLKSPSGVPFIEMLELDVYLSLTLLALAECHSLRC